MEDRHPCKQGVRIELLGVLKATLPEPRCRTHEDFISSRFIQSYLLLDSPLSSLAIDQKRCCCSVISQGGPEGQNFCGNSFSTAGQGPCLKVIVYWRSNDLNYYTTKPNHTTSYPKPATKMVVWWLVRKMLPALQLLIRIIPL